MSTGSSTLPAHRNPLDRKELAAAVAGDIPAGAVVNLGIGLPTKVADFIPPDREILLHSENGMLDMGPRVRGEAADPDLINAGKIPVSELPARPISTTPNRSP
jgi:3-oxoadipate CoA-transferase, beta subunit